MHGGIQRTQRIAVEGTGWSYLDFSASFRPYTDASNIGLGAILAQKQEGKERIICCASRTLNESEQNYSSTKKECLVMFWESRISEII